MSSLLKLAVVLASLVVLVPLKAHAQDRPDKLTPYRILPRFSKIHSTGQEGPDFDYRVRGTFDLAEHFNATEGWADEASFENVRAYALHPFQDNLISLNDLLNLENLKGKQLPVLGPYTAYGFEGTLSNGSTINLFAALLGRYLHISGESTPPPTGDDFPTLKVQILARQRPFTDFNDDGVTDGADLSTWIRHWGASPSVADATNLGDADGNHFVEGGDFLAWQRQQGEAAPGTAIFDAATAAALAIPEPAGFVLLAFAVAALPLARKFAR